MSLMQSKLKRIGPVVVLSLGILFALNLKAQTEKPPQPAQPPAPAQPAAPNPAPVLQSATRGNEPPLFPKDMVIMTIGEHKYTVEDFNQIMELFPAQTKTYYSGPGRRKFAEDFSQLIILSDEARRQKLNQDPIVKRRMELVSDQALQQALSQNIQENIKITDDEVQKYHAAHLNNYEQVKASHILIRVKDSPVPLPAGKKDLSDEEAKAKAEQIYKQVTAPGVDFAVVAKEESYDEGSASRGGELGFFRRGQMIPAFESTAFALKSGEISPPIKTQFGYHIIKVENKKTQSWEEAKNDIEPLLKRDKAQRTLEDLRNSVKIDLNSQFFPAPPTANPPTKPASEGDKKK